MPQMDRSPSSWMRVNFGCGIPPGKWKGLQRRRRIHGRVLRAAADLSLGQNHCRRFWDRADVVGWRSELQPQFSPAGQPFSGPLRLPLRNEQGSNQCTCTLDSKILESCLKSLPSKTISSYINQILQRSRTSRSLPACLSVYPSSIY